MNTTIHYRGYELQLKRRQNNTTSAALTICLPVGKTFIDKKRYSSIRTLHDEVNAIVMAKTWVCHEIAVHRANALDCRFQDAKCTLEVTPPRGMVFSMTKTHLERAKYPNDRTARLQAYEAVVELLGGGLDKESDL